jgi:3-methyladenine DNA glycosylase/8-oxoguanine DNA glycosylase
MPQPFDFGLTVERFAAFGPDRVNLVVDGVYSRVLEAQLVRIQAAPGGVDVEPALERLVAPVRRLLGAEADLVALGAVAAGDATLARVAAALRGLRPALLPDPFEMLVTSVTAQQISLRAALGIRNRLVERCGEPHGPVYAFPSRETVAALDELALLDVGFSRAKAAAVLAIARAELDLAVLEALPDEEVVTRLTALRGVGRWTAEWYLARHLGRPDVWPAGDLGLRRTIARLYLDGRDPDEREARTLGERFAPARTLAAQYLLTAMRVIGA